MRLAMVSAVGVIGLAMLTGSLSVALSRAPEPAAPRTRVGTYDNRAVAVAFMRSPDHQQLMKKWQDQYEKAKSDGDEKSMQRVRQAMDRMQWLAHRQGFGTASVDDAILSVKDRLPEVAKAAYVSVITCNPDYLSESEVDKVDVTDGLVALFNPDERVLKIVASLKKADRVAVDFDFQD